MPHLSKHLSDERRERILAAAYELIEAQGFAATSMDGIAARAEISKTTVYNYFASKEALLSAVIGRYATSFLTRAVEDLLRAESEAVPLETKLRAFAESVIRFLCRERSVGRFYRLVVGASVHSDVGEIFRKAGPAEALEEIGGYLGRAMRSGELAPTDPYLRARQLMAVIRAETDAFLLLGDFPELSEAEIRAMAERAVALYLRGAVAS